MSFPHKKLSPGLFFLSSPGPGSHLRPIHNLSWVSVCSLPQLPGAQYKKLNCLFYTTSPWAGSESKHHCQEGYRKHKRVVNTKRPLYVHSLDLFLELDICYFWPHFIILLIIYQTPFCLWISVPNCKQMWFLLITEQTVSYCCEIHSKPRK